MRNNKFVYVLNSMNHDVHLITHDFELVMEYLSQYDPFQMSNIAFSIDILKLDTFYFTDSFSTFRQRYDIKVDENMYFRTKTLFEHLGIVDYKGLEKLEGITRTYCTYWKSQRLASFQYKEEIERLKYEELKVKYGNN